MSGLANEIVRVRINEQLKNEATVVLEAMGLTMSDAIRIFLKRVVDEKALPFSLKMPRHLDASQMSKMSLIPLWRKVFVMLKRDVLYQLRKSLPNSGKGSVNDF